MKKKEKLVEDGINFNELMFQAFVNAYQSNIGHNLSKFKSSHFYLRQFVSQVREKKTAGADRIQTVSLTDRWR